MKLAEDLKKAVLQAAMQGKLTQQLQTDSSVDELLKKIAEEKETLIKEGKIKKDTTKSGASGRALAEISEEEIPFEIPENWRWCRLGEICTKLVDGDHNPPTGLPTRTEYLMLSSRNINNDKLVDLEAVRYLSKEIFEKENERTSAEKGDIFFTSVGTLGRSCVFDGSLNVCFQRSVSILRTLIYNYYLKYYFDSSYVQNFVFANATGTAQKGFYLNQLAKLIIPLPPIEEQQRIVEKLNQILPIIDSMAVYGTKKKAGRPKQEEALSFIRTFLQAKKQAQPKTAAPEILELKTKAKQELPAAVQKYAGLMGVTYNRITIRHQKTRWGSCTKTGNLNFNCLIMKMPDQVRDYVIIHELAHRKELNHSSKYWAIVAEYCPWYKKAKQWLKDNGQELMER